MTDSFQARSNYTGAAYEQHVAEYLKNVGYTILGRNVTHASGVQFDVWAKDPTGHEIGIECKAGTEESTNPGMRRSDNVWKVGGYVLQLQHFARMHPDQPRVNFFVATSHMPDPTSRWHRMLTAWELAGYLTIVIIPWQNEAAA